MPTNFELERLKLKLDIFKIPENRVHELTDSNVSHLVSPYRMCPASFSFSRLDGAEITLFP